jgi:hypothetical protein
MRKSSAAIVSNSADPLAVLAEQIDDIEDELCRRWLERLLRDGEQQSNQPKRERLALKCGTAHPHGRIED